ncbi:ribosomal protein S18-alanine N-acetyltransferase [Streptomyces sp. NPDC051776]|uniref:ribosomal protein S18-alanine N-acetyltransferase n=1 Tax=Streptomyces sp. NPDC051776 TaxID=3155414 RepID=UPI003432EDE3
MRWWDIEPVLGLERELFPDDAWSRGLFWSELAHARGPNATRRYIVAETYGGCGEEARGESAYGRRADGESGVEPGESAVSAAGRTIVGYGGLAAVDRTGDIQTIAAARAYWGTGLGARLLGDLLAGANDFECREVLLEVRVDNTRAQRLYERFGFEPIGLRPNYYQPGNVDAVVMRRVEHDADDEHGGTGHGSMDEHEQGMTNDG